MGHVQNCLYSNSVGPRLMALKGTEHWMTAGAVWCRWLATARKSLTDSDWVQKWPIMPDIVYKVLGYYIHFKHIYLPTRVICDWLLSATATGYFINGLWCIVNGSWSSTLGQVHLSPSSAERSLLWRYRAAIWKRRASNCNKYQLYHILFAYELKNVISIIFTFIWHFVIF